MNAVLVIGCGQVGTCAAAAIARRRVPVVACDPAADWEFFGIHGPEHPLACEAADMLDEDRIRGLVRQYHTDAIVMAAGLPEAHALVEGRDWEMIVEGAAAVIRTAVRERVRRLTFISSFAVYGDSLTESSIVESTPLEPVSSYGRSKVAAESVLEKFNHQSLDLRILRPCGVYGPYPAVRGSRSSRLIRGLLSTVILERDLRLAAPAGTLDELIYTEDLGEAIALTTLSPRPVRSRIFNVGTAARSTGHDLAHALEQAVPGSRVHIDLTPGPVRRQRPPLNIDRLRTELGFEPRFSLPEGFKAYVRELWPPSCSAIPPAGTRRAQSRSI